ncbi:AAA domain-containing protein [Pigmentiphaga aceris]|uniref:AAA domain-containing protein n=1 Tax=Pigmentiphaga aceris TaxID=1940612 RepID=A0A5C0AXK6_9BURK|nr:sigma 54-interacting transcriptional regulator [Pigmentiphaga aceris]QEI05570.1 AAA domain-containing protein [Pigmentiphaga aceris]
MATPATVITSATADLLRSPRPASRPTVDAVMEAVIGRGKKLIDKAVPILLLGETGTGKEYLTRLLHAHCARRDAPLVAVNCGAIPESLIESELFGYVKGAFSGALAGGMKGKVTEAHGGVLFLDEIGDMPLAQQTRLLRVLSEREVTPLGACRPVPVDFLLVCATTQNLEAKVADGTFREDLYYRIAGGVLRLPPLRERMDLAALILKFIQAELPDADAADVLPPSVMEVLLQQPWPGNVRQLSATIRYSCAVMEGSVLSESDLPDGMARKFAPPLSARSGRTVARPVSQVPATRASADNVYVLDTSRRDTGGRLDAGDMPEHAAGMRKDASERERVLDALDQHGWNMSASARALGICRASLYRVLRRMDIPLIREQASASTRSRNF